MSPGLGHVEVARQNMKEHGHVGGALNIGFPPLGVDAASGDANVAQKQLQHRCGPHILGSVGGLGNAHCIQNVAGFAGGAGGAEGGGHFFKVLGAAAHRPADRVFVVAGIVFFHYLKDRAGMLESEVLKGIALFVQFVLPALPVIGVAL